MKNRNKKRFLRNLVVLLLLVCGMGNLKNCLTKEVFYNDIQISRDLKSDIPLFFQSDKKWADKAYGNSDMENSGCGPTCLSMVCCGLTGNTKWTPDKVAEMAQKEGYYIEGVGTSWELMTTGAEKLGIHGEELSLDQNCIQSSLKEGHPIICAMGPGDFTTEGHFIVLVGLTEEGKLIINDPNSKENSERAWDPEQVMGQMKNLWRYEV